MSSLSTFIAMVGLCFTGGTFSFHAQAAEDVQEVLDTKLNLFDSMIVVKNADETIAFKAMRHLKPNQISYRYLGKRGRYHPGELDDLKVMMRSGFERVFGGVMAAGAAAAVLAGSACAYLGRICVIAALGPLAAPAFEGYASRGFASQLGYLSAGAGAWVMIGVTVIGSGVVVGKNIGRYGEVKEQLLNNSTVKLDRSWFRRYTDYLLRGTSPHATTEELLTQHILEIEKALYRVEKSGSYPMPDVTAPQQ